MVLHAAVNRAAALGMLLVAARDDQGVTYFPGSLAGVVPVQVDWSLQRREFRVVDVDGTPVVRASGLPREIPGVPPSRNLHGVSFAVANATGIIARAIENANPVAAVGRVFERLKDVSEARNRQDVRP
jgi:hypothetical protein